MIKKLILITLILNLISFDSSKSIAAPLSGVSCTATQKIGGSRWISGQLGALKNLDAKKSYSFASENFRSKITLSEFIAIISTNYAMLLDLRTYSINSCNKQNGQFHFNLSMTDNDGRKYLMEYVLSFQKQRWGVEAAKVDELIKG